MGIPSIIMNFTQRKPVGIPRRWSSSFLFSGALAALVAAAPSRGQGLDPVPPPLSIHKSRALHADSGTSDRFPSRLASRAPGAAEATSQPAAPGFGGTWQTVTALPASVGLCNPLLLTDGSVIAANCDTPDWYRLTPDAAGDYATGTWTQIASLPVIGGIPYAPEYHASAVLADGRAIIMGGEYNGGDNEVWTSSGAIYDPLKNTWTAVAPPAGAGWVNTSTTANDCNGGIGDAASVVLADGTFMLTAACASPDVDALFDAAKLGWTAAAAPGAGDHYQDEQGYELLPNGNVLTIDVWSDYPNGNATNAEQYVPSSNKWISAGSTPVSLVDPIVCGNFEIGPAVLRGDGTLVAFGGDTGCTGDADPTAIFDVASGTWSAGPSVPQACAGAYCTLADAPAALLPNGNILFAASPGFGNPPAHFFEFTRSNTIEQVADEIDNASSSASYYYNFLVLPNGQILSTDFSNVAEVYTPGGTAVAGWAPTIGSAPASIAPGSTYPISGTQFNGLSQGAYYGDDVQAATNYPLVRITNSATGHVFYARTSGVSTGSIAPGAAVSANFSVPATIEAGAAQLVVVANGIASKPIDVSVERETAIATTTKLAAAPISSSYGTAVTLTATVKAASGTAVPSGTVSFKRGTVTLGSSTLADGVAKFTTSTLPEGEHSLLADYAGNTAAKFQASASTEVTVHVSAVATKTTLSASPSTVGAGSPVTLTATVSPDSGTGIAHGKVNFFHGKISIGSATLSGAGKAALSVTGLPVGIDALTAAYVGSAEDEASASAPVSVTVQ